MIRITIIAALFAACAPPTDTADTADIECAVSYDEGCDLGTQHGGQCIDDRPPTSRVSDTCYLDGYYECAERAYSAMGEGC